MHTKEFLLTEIEEKTKEYNHSFPMKQLDIITETALKDSRFREKLDDLISDAYNDAIDHLGIDPDPMSEDESDILDEFMEKGDWIIAPGRDSESEYICYLWEDFKSATEYVKKHGGYLYTLRDEGVITKGAGVVNRFAYLISEVEVPLGRYDEVRYW